MEKGTGRGEEHMTEYEARKGLQDGNRSHSIQAVHTSAYYLRGMEKPVSVVILRGESRGE